ncbi:MAG TPA: hypothetical protein VM489_05165 [Burkholderiales bacterium]|nr:hypothetical protein [Burkholderiales bacterium]
MRFLFAIAVAVTALGAAAAESFHVAVHGAAPAHPALYSFVDLYRITVSDPLALPLAQAEAPEAPVRVAAAAAARLPAELQFSIGGAGEGGSWTLLLAGMALALWVARRRLEYF